MTRHFFVVGFWTMISRFLGLTREVLMSHLLGAGMITDAFIIAIKIPNFFRRFSAEGALNSAFVPYFTRIHAQHGLKKANEVLSRVFLVMLFVLLAFIFLGEMGIEGLVKMTAPGFTGERLALTIHYAVWTLPYILFISLAAILTGAANTLGRFAHGAASHSILNICIITVLIWFLYFPGDPGKALCIALLVAGVLQQMWMHLVCKKAGIHILWIRKPLNHDVREVLRKMVPGIIGASVAQLSIFVDTIMASFLQVGSVAFLFYADRLYQLPLSIFGTTVATVLLPSLSRFWAENKTQDALYLQKKALGFSLLLTCPAAIGLFVLAFPIIHLVYGHGKFSAHDIAATAPALAAFSLGLPAHVISKVFNASFFANRDTKTPVIVALISVGCNILLNFLFMPTLKHIGLALATSIAAWINIILLGFILKKRNQFSFDKDLGIFFFKVFLISLLVSTGLVFLINYAPAPHTFWQEMIYVGGFVLFGFTLFLVGGYGFGAIKGKKLSL